MKKYLLILLAFVYVYAVGQAPPVVPKHLYGIKNPEIDVQKFCERCITITQNKPEEVGMAIQYNPKDNFLYFYLNDKNYFDQYFSNPFDGVAADILYKEQFACNVVPKPNPNQWLYHGYLAPPVYTPELKKNAVTTPEGWVIVKLGQLPAFYKGKEIEVNTVVLSDRYKCGYNTFFDIVNQKWGLLEMGMYLDTLTEETVYERSSFSSRQLKFEIPFQKDKAEYLAKDIKPLYDSLKLSKYVITSVTIRAFSSVEGTTERNNELQSKRAQSILKALQTLQNINFDSVRKEIIVSENWVDFYNSIVGTAFSNMSTMGKDEIKTRLNTDKKLVTDMESILRKHRKAVVLMELQPRSSLKEDDPDKIQALYDKAIASKNIKDAIAIQKEIFMRIRSHKLPDNFTARMEVPEGLEYSLLKNSRLAFQYQEEITDLVTTLEDFMKLSFILPDNHRIRYNIAVLKLRGWLSNEVQTDPVKLKAEIESLSKFPGLDKRLVKRLLINYHIILCEKLMAERRYNEKNEALKYIYENYAILSISEADLVSLAQYFVGYVRQDLATSLLYPYAKRIDVTEELLFYYINLTIAYDQIVASSEYRNIMLNAINTNKKRFCSLFNTYHVDGGMTFQLLGNPTLKKTKCESCK